MAICRERRRANLSILRAGLKLEAVASLIVGSLFLNLLLDLLEDREIKHF